MNESEIFNAAVKLSADERAKFLELACKHDPVLRKDVDGLLKAHDDSQTFLGDVEEDLAQRHRDAEGENQPPKFPRPGFQRSPADAPQFPLPGFRREGRKRGLHPERDDDQTSANLSETAGTVIAGKYKLLDKPIGEGGMGTVWMAEQRAPVKRLVAIKLCGLLRNELDWIVMKALEKDRARRYETANGFAADINRYLAGEAVLAHPPSRAYRLKKFLRKNKGPVLAASLPCWQASSARRWVCLRQTHSAKWPTASATEQLPPRRRPAPGPTN